MDKDVSYYIDTIKKYFTVEERIRFVAPFLSTFEVNKQRENIQYGKVKLEPTWEQLIGDLKATKSYYIRDCGPGSPLHSFTGILGYGPEVSEGIVFSISIPFKRYGFYYCKYVPIEGSKNRRELISFTPIDVQMSEIKAVLADTIRSRFTDMEEFDPSIAELTIDTLAIYEFRGENLNLWQIVFNDYLHGIY
jgi:hypothetical protein